MTFISQFAAESVENLKNLKSKIRNMCEDTGRIVEPGREIPAQILEICDYSTVREGRTAMYRTDPVECDPGPEGGRYGRRDPFPPASSPQHSVQLRQLPTRESPSYMLSSGSISPCPVSTTLLGAYLEIPVATLASGTTHGKQRTLPPACCAMTQPTPASSSSTERMTTL